MLIKDVLASVGEEYHFSQASSESDIAECQRVRHQVYCEDKGWEPSSKNFLEVDHDDENAIHILITHRDTGTRAGTFRIILSEELPICHFLDKDHILHPSNSPANTACEISRFSLLKEFRGKDLTTALILFAGYQVAVLGKPIFYAVMEKMLARRINREGVPTRQLSEEFQHNGLRAVYRINTSEIISPVTDEVGFHTTDLSSVFHPLIAANLHHLDCLQRAI